MGRRGASIAVVCAVVVVAAGIAVGIAATRNSGSKAAAKDGPVTILWIGDTTGPVEAYGNVQLAGVKGAAAYFNSRGGIDGHRVVVRAVSDNGDPATAASVLTQQLASGLPTMVWPGSTSSDSAALIPILARYDVFAVGLVDGQAQCKVDAAQRCAHQWFLSNPVGVAQQAAVNWIKSKQLSSVGVLAETTPQSAAGTPLFLHAAAKNGFKVKTVDFPTTAVDLTPELQELRQGGPQVIYAEGIGAAKYVFSARADLGWNVPVLFDPSASSLDLTKLTDSTNLKNAYELTLYEHDSGVSNPALATMVQWAGKYADVTALQLVSTSVGWDAVVALNAAVVKAGGSLNVRDLDAAMLKLPPTDPLRTLTHKLGWTTDDHENALGAADDSVVIPVGPLVNGRVQSP